MIAAFFPIIHTRADMGAFDQSIRKVVLRKIGKAALRRKDNVINNMWSTTEKTIDSLDLPHNRPTIRASIAIARILAHFGGNARMEDPNFRCICRDVLNIDTAKVTRGGQSLMPQGV